MARILLVEDAQFMRAQMARLLIQNGHEVIEAEDGVQALALYRQTQPQVVLLDLVMPRKDGLQTLTEIRQFDENANIIMLTALDQPLAALKAIQGGARDFLAKTSSQRSILDAINRVLYMAKRQEPALAVS